MDRFLIKSKKNGDEELPTTSKAALQKSVAMLLETSSESDTANDSEIEEITHSQPASSSKRLKVCRKYSQEWELVYRWIKEDPKSKRPICTACDQILVNQKAHIDRHASTKKHISNLKRVAESKKLQIQDFLPNLNCQFRKSVAIAEIKLVMRTNSASQSFNSMDKLAKFNSMIYPDSKIAQMVSCGRTKANQIAHFLGEEGFLAMIQKMKSQMFSLIIDETTDISTDKCLVIVVRQYDVDQCKTKDQFFRLLKPDDSFSQTICNAVLTTLEKNAIPLNNFVGFATDNASTMVGCKTGVATLLKKEIPNLFHIGCVCHTVNLINKAAFKCIPEDVEQLLRNVFKYLNSAKRQTQFYEVQAIFNVPEHKLLRLSNTRWLSFESVANRVLEQWSVLQTFFIQEQFEESCPKNLNKIDSIQNGLSATNKIYLQFIAFVLSIMNKLNKNFQSESSQIIYLIPNTKKIVLQLFNNFLKKEYVLLTELGKINFYNVLYIKDVNSIYIGHEAESTLRSENFSKDQISAIKSNILSFYQRLCDQILSRIDLNDKRLSVLKFLDPTSIKSNIDIDYFDLISQFSYVISDPDEFVTEFQSLEAAAKEKSYEHIFQITDAEEFWGKIGGMKGSLNEPLFPNLYKFVINIFTLPHSSACAERIFSKLSLMKNKVTNRLKVETCDERLSALNLIDNELEDWMPSSELVEKYRKNITKK